MISEALEAGVKAEDTLDVSLLDGMGKLGVRSKNNEVYVPEVLIAARAQQGYRDAETLPD